MKLCNLVIKRQNAHRLKERQIGKLCTYLSESCLTYGATSDDWCHANSPSHGKATHMWIAEYFSPTKTSTGSESRNRLLSRYLERKSKNHSVWYAQTSHAGLQMLQVSIHGEEIARQRVHNLIATQVPEAAQLSDNASGHDRDH